jgi:excisionase family DNA binding protein
MLTAAAAATWLGVSAKLIYKLFRSGELAGVKIAGAMRIHRESVTAYLSAHSNKKPAPPQPTPAPKRRRRSAASVGFVHLRPQQT